MANVLSLVSYKIFPAKLGGQKGIACFNKYFSQFHNLTCVTIKDNDPALAEYEVLNILSNSKFRYINPFYFFTLRKVISKKNITHLIVEHPYFGWLGILLKWFCGVKLIIHSHNIEAHRFKSVGKWWWGILWNYERFVHRRANFTFCITEEDREYMIRCFKLKPDKCTTITYGIEWNSPPSTEDRQLAKSHLCGMYKLSLQTHLFLFNGTLNYFPNLNAVKYIVEKINPILLAGKQNYRIIICGKGLPPEMNELVDHEDRNIIYAGFVNDIAIYFKGVDTFINPVNDGGGIKTKLVEALGYDLNAVSTINGAIGVDENICNGKLLLTANEDWISFAEKMIASCEVKTHTPPEYFQHFYWQSIAKKAAGVIEEIRNRK